MILSVLPLESITDQTINVPEGDVLMLSMHNETEIIVSGKKKPEKQKNPKRIESVPSQNKSRRLKIKF